MKSLPKRTRQVLFILSLLLFLALTALNFPVRSAVQQATPSPTATPTPVYINGEEVLQSGDTQGLILGAGLILVIILAGVIIQRLILKFKVRN